MASLLILTIEFEELLTLYPPEHSVSMRFLDFLSFVIPLGSIKGHQHCKSGVTLSIVQGVLTTLLGQQAKIAPSIGIFALDCHVRNFNDRSDFSDSTFQDRRSLTSFINVVHHLMLEDCPGGFEGIDRLSLGPRALLREQIRQSVLPES